MLAQPAAAAIDDLPGALRQAAVAGEEGALALAGEKAQVLALGLARHRQPRAGGELAHLGLGELGEREAKARERFRSQSREHVGLILGGVGGGAQQGPSPSSASLA